MILTDKVYIKMNGKHISKYRDMGYECKVNESILVDIKNVLKNSHILIEAKCEICNTQKYIKYRVYNKNFEKDGYYACSVKCGLYKYRNTCNKNYGVDNYSKTIDCKEKIMITNLIRYGSKSPAGNEKVLKKMSLTNMKKYGVENVFKSEYFKSLQINNGRIVVDDLRSDFEKYRLLVKKSTRRNKEKLFENWNGFDYYDDEDISGNLNLEYNNIDYPTIDHKISIFNGFKNNIDPNFIGSINNLCITKRRINSSKGLKNNY